MSAGPSVHLYASSRRSGSVGNGGSKAGPAIASVLRPPCTSHGDRIGSDADVGKVTGGPFGRLFSDFVADSFWQIPFKQFQTRVERNGICPRSLLSGKGVLDAGCGAGRLSFVFHALGGCLKSPVTSAS